MTGPSSSVTQSDEGEVERKNQKREADSKHIRQQHRDTGNAPVNKVARLQETMDSHARGQDPQDNEQSIRKFT